MTATAPTVPFPVTPRRAGEPEADLTGFAVAHRGLLGGSRLLADATTAVAAGAPCPPERRAAIGWYARHVLDEVHAHHHKEDDVLWPVIVASAGERADLAGLTADHVALQHLLDRADAALPGFVAGGPAGVLATALTAIADELTEHIAEEEDVVFAVIREHVSAGDFARCEKLFQRGAKPKHLLFLMPWFVANATPEQISAMGRIPLPVRVMLALGQRRYHRAEQLVRGS